ncbi:MAG: M3 family oligoendopeptidase [Candidatus Doudnabacteria bacterium]|nr:M3 family oligoendopeptidase [Candidatus Doudnabacteria bacterium]
MKENLPSWDLRAFYKNINDPKIKLDMKASLILAQNFAKKYRKIVNDRVLAKQLLKILREYESIILKAIKPQLFAQLVFEADSANHAHGALLHQTQQSATEVGKELVFFELALSSLSEKKLNNLAQNSLLKNYKNYLTNQVKWKKHRLSEAEEKILADKDLTSREAFSRLFVQFLSRKQFEIKLGRKKKMLNEEQVLTFLHNADRNYRKSASVALTQGLKQESFLLTYIFNTLSKDKALETRLRKFKTFEEGRHLGNQIDQKTVDVMSSAVSGSYGLVSDFYRLKKKILGLPKLYDYDRYAPTADFNQVYTYVYTKDLIIKTFGRFSKEFAKIAQEFFLKNWIDAPTRHGKRGGAFCSYGTPDTHPVVLTNFQGKLRDVQTLAHELGHGINAYLMRKQTPINFDNPLTLAETASVFAEMLIFEELNRSIKDEKVRLALYMDKIENIIATVYRQIAMYKFEQDFHALRLEKGELRPEEINELWRKRQKEMFGKSLELTEGYDWWWSYVPHFIENPFYVYAYAFGELLVLSLYARYKKDGPKFVEKYIELLSAGSSAAPEELLNPFGINLKDKKFWQEGIGYIQDLLKEAKKIAQKN